MDFLIIAVLIGLLIALTLKAKRKREQEKQDREPEKKSGWYINYSPGMPPRPVVEGKELFFDFPTVPESHVHYLQWFSPPSLVGATHIRVRFSITGNVFVPQEFPDRPASVSLLIQRKGDDWGAIGPMQSYRWYSKEVCYLGPGEFALLVPLDVSEWGDVYSGRDPVAFAAVLSDLDNIGLVFGSAGGRGHGVYATEPSRFTLKEIEVLTL